jgi:predicted protein tyrosine phosphatase
MNDITELRPNLHVTDADGVGALSEEHPFDEVVTLGYMDIFGKDYPDASTTEEQFKFRDGPHDYEQFEAAAAYVVEHLQADDSVLVHCQAGVSRSPAICIAAIATLENRSPEDARTAVEDIHPRTNPEPRVWESTIRFVEANR